ncbi:MAG TPA: restriction endonuclease subunit S [Alcaligenes faecalis]|nr:restriction endonuclease subunit S [Alcaligenes faecalis]
MSLPRYSGYKQSSKLGLGKLPSHWVVTRLSRITTQIKDGTHGTFARVSEGMPLLSAKNVLDGHLTLSDSESLISEKNHTEIVANGFPKKGDLLLTIVGTIGRSCIYKLDHPIAFQRSVCFIRLSRGQIPQFFYYFTQSRLFQDQLTERSKSSAQAGVYMGDVAATTAVFPPTAEEQVAIASFLDSETAKIDALISEQEKLIALLAEKRQATISHAVTRGLNPDARMKDSGVEWLGEIPAHWNLIRIKHVITSISQGWSPQCESFPVSSSDEWGVLKVGCVNGGVFRASENKKLPSELEPIPAYSIKKGDLLISRANTRDLVGSAAVVEEDFNNLMLCDKLYRLNTISDQCLPSYMSGYIGTLEARSQIELQATGASSSMLNIGQSVILELVMPLPSITEQEEITKFIAAETKKADAINTESEKAIVLLRERRSALITAAVTGQIDVRDSAAQIGVEEKTEAIYE